jgi:hypothetical protein
MAQTKNNPLDSVLPVRGLAIAAPSREGLNDFVRFVEQELAMAHFNLLIIRIDWNYDYQSHPELKNNNPLTNEHVKLITDVCKKHNIRIAPQINLLGHQSWAKTTANLLRVYPQFDETPHIKTEDYTGWPNKDNLYCKSYCPLHPDVHKVVFDLIDEITNAFDTDLFHAGMDEVFYIGDDNCPRCQGRDKAELFAGEVITIRNHLANTNKKLMIWGDRLLDGKTTGLGIWEASFNHTHKAIDIIPKDVFICDWHYDRPDPTAPYFAIKGFNVATCPWRKPQVAITQLDNMIQLRTNSTTELAQHFQGIIHTVWSGTDQFVKHYYIQDNATQEQQDEVITLKKLMEAYKHYNDGKP